MMEGGSDSDSRIHQASVKLPLDKRVKFESDVNNKETTSIFKNSSKAKKPQAIAATPDVVSETTVTQVNTVSTPMDFMKQVVANLSTRVSNIENKINMVDHILKNQNQAIRKQVGVEKENWMS